LDEITVQAALLKKLVRRNMKNEDNETTINTPIKVKDDALTLNNFQKSRKINLPMLVLEFKKNSDIEILMNEDHKELVIVSDSNWRLYNDNHVLLSTGLLNESEQGNIENLYETEVKPLESSHHEEEKDNDMRPPSPTGNVKIKVSNIGKLQNKGGIINISSPFKESEWKDPNLASPFCKSFLSPLCSKYVYQDSPLLKDTLTPFRENTPAAYTPLSNMGDNREDHGFSSPFLHKQVSFGLNG